MAQDGGTYTGSANLSNAQLREQVDLDASFRAASRDPEGSPQRMS